MLFLMKHFQDKNLTERAVSDNSFRNVFIILSRNKQNELHNVFKTLPLLNQNKAY